MNELYVGKGKKLLHFNLQKDRPGDDELAEAHWFSRAQLADPEALGIRLPRHDSIARRLIDDWIALGD